MNLKELNSFKLSDAVTFHDKLNPKLWNGTKLRPEVREQLLKIAEDFLTELGVHDLDVKDITISGSNAAYSYTKYSDLDLHILVDMGNLPVDEVYRELFTAKKTIYNDTHDITIHKIPVELYVQDSRQPVVSLGEYSVMNDQWIKIPTKRRSDFDQTATKSKYEKLLSLIEIALQSKQYSKVKHIIDTIKRYRQAGLDKGGEFGPENLAYKMLRSQGYITKLYDLRDKLHSEKLSFETMYQNIDEETNHWYDAGVKDAQRDAKQYPDRVVKKLNPRTRLKTMQDKRARHPEEVEQYSLGYRGVTQDVDENTAAGINKMFNNLGDPVFANLQRVALLAMQGRQQEAAGRLQTVIKDANPAVQKKITDAVNNIKPVTINGRVADSSTLDKSKQHNDWIINTFIPWVQSLLGQQGVAEGATVTRIDSKPITDFGSSLKAYKHTDDWSQSGVDTGDDSYWKNKNLKTNTTKGLFAGDPKRTALYATGNAHETRYVEFTQNGQPIVYFDQKDLPAMRSRKTYLTVFDANDFRQLPTGEWFSENPGKPIKQIPIGDPFKYIASQGWIVRVTDDLDKVFKQVKNMHKAGKIAQYGAEGMNESKQGVAEARKNPEQNTKYQSGWAELAA